MMSIEREIEHRAATARLVSATPCSPLLGWLWWLGKVACFIAVCLAVGYLHLESFVFLLQMTGASPTELRFRSTRQLLSFATSTLGFFVSYLCWRLLLHFSGLPPSSPRRREGIHRRVLDAFNICAAGSRGGAATPPPQQQGEGRNAYGRTAYWKGTSCAGRLCGWLCRPVRCLYGWIRNAWPLTLTVALMVAFHLYWTLTGHAKNNLSRELALLLCVAVTTLVFYLVLGFALLFRLLCKGGGSSGGTRRCLARTPAVLWAPVGFVVRSGLAALRWLWRVCSGSGGGAAAFPQPKAAGKPLSPRGGLLLLLLLAVVAIAIGGWHTPASLVSRQQQGGGAGLDGGITSGARSRSLLASLLAVLSGPPTAGGATTPAVAARAAAAAAIDRLVLHDAVAAEDAAAAAAAVDALRWQPAEGLFAADRTASVASPSTWPHAIFRGVLGGAFDFCGYAKKKAPVPAGSSTDPIEAEARTHPLTLWLDHLPRRIINFFTGSEECPMYSANNNAPRASSSGSFDPTGSSSAAARPPRISHYDDVHKELLVAANGCGGAAAAGNSEERRAADEVPAIVLFEHEQNMLATLPLLTYLPYNDFDELAPARAAMHRATRRIFRGLIFAWPPERALLPPFPPSNLRWRDTRAEATGKMPVLAALTEGILPVMTAPRIVRDWPLPPFPRREDFDLEGAVELALDPDYREWHREYHGALAPSSLSPPVPRAATLSSSSSSMPPTAPWTDYKWQPEEDDEGDSEAEAKERETKGGGPRRKLCLPVAPEALATLRDIESGKTLAELVAAGLVPTSRAAATLAVAVSVQVPLTRFFYVPAARAGSDADGDTHESAPADSGDGGPTVGLSVVLSVWIDHEPTATHARAEGPAAAAAGSGKVVCGRVRRAVLPLHSSTASATPSSIPALLRARPPPVPPSSSASSLCWSLHDPTTGAAVRRWLPPAIQNSALSLETTAGNATHRSVADRYCGTPRQARRMHDFLAAHLQRPLPRESKDAAAEIGGGGGSNVLLYAVPPLHGHMYVRCVPRPVAARLAAGKPTTGADAAAGPAGGWAAVPAGAPEEQHVVPFALHVVASSRRRHPPPPATRGEDQQQQQQDPSAAAPSVASPADSGSGTRPFSPATAAAPPGSATRSPPLGRVTSTLVVTVDCESRPGFVRDFPMTTAWLQRRRRVQDRRLARLAALRERVQRQEVKAPPTAATPGKDDAKASVPPSPPRRNQQLAGAVTEPLPLPRSSHRALWLEMGAVTTAGMSTSKNWVTTWNGVPSAQVPPLSLLGARRNVYTEAKRAYGAGIGEGVITGLHSAFCMDNARLLLGSDIQGHVARPTVAATPAALGAALRGSNETIAALRLKDVLGPSRWWRRVEKTDGMGGPNGAIDDDVFAPYCHGSYGPFWGNFQGPYSLLRRCQGADYVHNLAFRSERAALFDLLGPSSSHAVEGRCEDDGLSPPRAATLPREPAAAAVHPHAIPFFRQLYLMEAHEGSHAVARLVDADLVAFLDDLDDMDFFDTAALLLVSDHGGHMGPYVQWTEAGKAERAMPFAMWALPPGRVVWPSVLEAGEAPPRGKTLNTGVPTTNAAAGTNRSATFLAPAAPRPDATAGEGAAGPLPDADGTPWKVNALTALRNERLMTTHFDTYQTLLDLLGLRQAVHRRATRDEPPPPPPRAVPPEQRPSALAVLWQRVVALFVDENARKPPRTPGIDEDVAHVAYLRAHKARLELGPDPLPRGASVFRRIEDVDNRFTCDNGNAEIDCVLRYCSSSP